MQNLSAARPQNLPTCYRCGTEHCYCAICVCRSGGAPEVIAGIYHFCRACKAWFYEPHGVAKGRQAC
jgi:hypothetical protein